jgi:tRNA threonylcarbamoyladenosine biosynthesis protein TsaE
VVRVETFYTIDQTIAFGFDLGQKLSVGSIVCLYGDLGAGKTTLIKGIAAGATGVDIMQVNSPTFVYLNIYQGHRVVYHFDLYRLRNADEFLSMGFDEFLWGDGICCIEWSERIQELLPPNSIKMTLLHAGKDKRLLRMEE